jgi:hypothetical protein
MAYYSIEPFGEWRADVRQALTSMVIANVFRGKKGKASKVRDFMPFEKKRKKRRQQTKEEMMAVLDLLT